MAYNSTEIATVTPPAAAQAPDLNEYQTPDVEVTKPTIDTGNTGYVAPDTSFQAKNVDTGLLEYDPTSSENLTFDGREINASAIGANVKQTTPDFETADNFLTEGAFVENRVAGLLEDPNNTLNQRMKANGLADSNSRGMANSTMGATIGQAVLADKAIQIATPDAATQATGDLTHQKVTYDAQGKIQDTELQGSLAEQAGKINSALESQQAGNSWDSTEQKAAIQGDLNVQGAKINDAQVTQKAEYDHDARNQQGLLEGAATEQKANVSGELAGLESVSSQNLSILQDKLQSAGRTTQEQNAALMQEFSAQQDIMKTTLNAEFAKATSQAQLNAAQRESLSSAMTTMANNYEISVQNILLDMNLDAETKNAAIVRINKIFNEDMKNISSVFGADYSEAGA